MSTDLKDCQGRDGGVVRVQGGQREEVMEETLVKGLELCMVWLEFGKGLFRLFTCQVYGLRWYGRKVFDLGGCFGWGWRPVRDFPPVVAGNLVHFTSILVDGHSCKLHGTSYQSKCGVFSPSLLLGGARQEKVNLRLAPFIKKDNADQVRIALALPWQR